LDRAVKVSNLNEILKIYIYCCFNDRNYTIKRKN